MKLTVIVDLQHLVVSIYLSIIQSAALVRINKRRRTIVARPSKQLTLHQPRAEGFDRRLATAITSHPPPHLPARLFDRLNISIMSNTKLDKRA